MRIQDKIRGAIVGGALGDAWGAPVEKLSYQKIRETYGSVDSLDYEHYRTKSKTHGKGFGRFTDDTLMTLLLCEVYQESKDHLHAYSIFPLVRKIYFEEMWVPEFQKKMPLIERLFYPEKYIFLSNYLANRDPRSGGVGNMVNCGAAMYISPIGMLNAADTSGAYQEAIAFASAHQSSYGLEAAGVQAGCVAYAMSPHATIAGIIQTAVDLAKDGTKKAIEAVIDAVPSIRAADNNGEQNVQSASSQAFHNAIKPFSPMEDNLERIPEKVGMPSENYTPSRLKSIEELPIALGYILLYNGDFLSALKAGVNSGRDTDSIGCMIGTILGAFHGIQTIPDTFIEKLKNANLYDLIAIADRFTETVLQIQEQDRKRLQFVQSERYLLNE